MALSTVLNKQMPACKAFLHKGFRTADVIGQQSDLQSLKGRLLDDRNSNEVVEKIAIPDKRCLV